VIYVDGLVRRRGTFWRGHLSCRMISDDSREELESFAASIGMPTYWYQPWFFPHFELSGKWRKKAINAGAIDCGGLQDGLRHYTDAMRRFRHANPFLFPEDP
jgi:hypothetical protein